MTEDKLVIQHSEGTFKALLTLDTKQKYVAWFEIMGEQKVITSVISTIPDYTPKEPSQEEKKKKEEEDKQKEKA